ncbi:hypothetical protein [Phytomonospora endophytica]|uniref:Uncharacterized protein n=1 Tax=Phytomonospora endophytica TaxID=714109 RepID=A0A841FHG2_9ACTN|nr:hypothetical protein [Phytomonospora endophytica]MBB6035656.1 hypothetical protein [Phytomonospora endophytica]
MKRQLTKKPAPKKPAPKKSTSSQPFGRKVAVWIGAAALLVGGVSWAGVGCMNQSSEVSRSVSAEEAGRLANMRAHNLALGTVAILAKMPEELGETEISGWVDWTQPLVYAAIKPSAQPTYTGLVQAVPGLVATRAGDMAADPEKLPADGWTVRRTAGGVPEGEAADPLGQALDIVLSAVMVLGSDGPDDTSAFQERAVWLDESSIDGVTVDVFRSPLVVGTAPAPDPSADASQAPPAAAPEAMFHIDRSGQLRRVQINPGGHGLATVDLLVEQRPDPEDARIPAIDLLGGPPVTPRKVTDAEAQILAGLRPNNADTVSEVKLTLPVGDGELLSAVGWVDWRRPLAYLTVDNPGAEDDGEMFVLPGGVSWRPMPVEGKAKKPSLPAAPDGWQTQQWAARIDGETGASDLDLLLFKLLTMASGGPDDLAAIKDTASWLRESRLGKTHATTFELPMPGDQSAPSGQAPYRYWLDAEEHLRRVEMRTAQFGLGRADLKPTRIAWIDVPAAALVGLT